MTPITIFLILILTVMIVGIIAMTTKGKNLITKVLHKKEYVYVHLIHEESLMEEVICVIPERTGLTKVKKFEYTLLPEYATLRWKNRLHFIVHEKDAIPKYPTRVDSNEEILFRADEISNALNADAYAALFGKKSQMVLVLISIALIISLLTCVYLGYKISTIESMLQFLVQKT